MTWVRGNRRIGAWLALFALALQLVLSFGHIHLGDIAIPQASAATTQTGTADTGTPSHRHHGVADICAICATLNLTASSVLPTVASLVLPVAFAQAPHPDFRSARISSEPYFLFRARAPPVLL